MIPVKDQGLEGNRYTLIPRVLIFITRGDQVLLLKGNPGKTLWAGKFNGIGGHIEAGEDPLSAANRELYEETGLILERSMVDPGTSGLRLSGILIVDTGKNPGVCIFLYRGETTSTETHTSPEGTLHWIKVDQLESLPVVEDLPVLINKIRKMKPTDPPFSACSYYRDNKLVIKIFE